MATQSNHSEPAKSEEIKSVPLTWQQRNKDRVNEYRRKYRKLHGYGPTYVAKHGEPKRVHDCIHCGEPLGDNWRLHPKCIIKRIRSLRHGNSTN